MKDQIGKSHWESFLFHLWSFSGHLSSLTNARCFPLEGAAVGPTRELAGPGGGQVEPACGLGGQYPSSETLAAVAVLPVGNSNNNKQ